MTNNSSGLITYMSKEEAIEAQKYIDEYTAKLQKKFARRKNISKFLKCMFFSPLSICIRVISFIVKLVGCVLSIGMPYGIYSMYKTAEQLIAGTAINDIEHTKWIILLFIVPFIAFGAYYLLEKLADYFELNK